MISEKILVNPENKKIEDTITLTYDQRFIRRKKLVSDNNFGFLVNLSETVSLKKNDLLSQNIIPDIVINNAAGNFLCPFENLSENAWDRIIDIVLKGTFNTTSLFGKEFIKHNNKGVFLNISTTYADTGSALVSPSAAAKAGSDALLKSLSVEWARHNIRFVGIAPGPIENTGGADKLDPFNIFKYINNYTNPRNRMCKQDEISNLAM